MAKKYNEKRTVPKSVKISVNRNLKKYLYIINFDVENYNLKIYLQTGAAFGFIPDSFVGVLKFFFS